ncbi:3-hydroxylacyl-ACP dehydratase, partial [Acinetobacter baumannii]|nr:3-hydroxylacyl-ACP dehydratase [Acinetobacter baumannii]
QYAEHCIQATLSVFEPTESPFE